MNQKLLFFFLIVLILGPPVSSKASHITGGDITYTAVPGFLTKAIITVHLFRDCFGVPYEDSITVSWNSPSGCGPTGSTTLPPVQGTGVGNEIQTSAYAPCSTSTCTGGSGYGIQEWVYSGVVDFGATCPDWEISYESCCRNAALNTAAPNNMYIETAFDNLNFQYDNSPVFNHPAVATFCVSHPYQLDMSCTDPDGDSLVYTMTDSWDAAGAPVNYNPPYSGMYPISSMPPPSIDPQTGIITYHPNTVQVGVMAVLVEAYDRILGQLKSTTRRDVQLNVEVICNDQPIFDSLHVIVDTASLLCMDTVLNLHLRFPVQCSSLSPDGTDFRLLQPNGIPVLIRAATAHSCDTLGLTDSITLFLRVPLALNGFYKLVSKIGYDGNTLLNPCNVAIQELQDTCFFLNTHCPQGVHDLDKMSIELMVFPNPVSGRLDVQTNMEGKRTFRVYDMLGNILHEEISYSSSWWVDLSGLSNGTYWLEGQDTRHIGRARFVVNH